MNPISIDEVLEEMSEDEENIQEETTVNVVDNQHVNPEKFHMVNRHKDANS